jgi:hypothetical protein
LGSHLSWSRSVNMTSAAYGARLLPSGRGWFHASRQTRTAAW